MIFLNMFSKMPDTNIILPSLAMNRAYERHLMSELEISPYISS